MRFSLSHILILPLITLIVFTGLPVVLQSQNALTTKYTLATWKLKEKVDALEEIKYKAEQTANGVQKGKVMERLTYRFDRAGNLLEEASYADGKLRYKTAYTYDNAGKKLALESYNAQGLQFFSTYDYDTGGTKMMGENTYKSNGRLSWKNKNHYNSSGRLDEQVLYEPDGSKKTVYTYLYDAKGNQIEETLTDTVSKLNVKWVSTYDAHGNRVTLTRFSGTDTGYKQTFAYDAKGNQTEACQLNPDGSIKLKLVYVYDEYGNQLEVHEMTADGVTRFQTTYAYRYDTQKNWVYRMESLDQNARYIVERTITYYP